MKLKNLPIILGFIILLLTLPAAVFLLSQRQEARVGAGLTASAIVYLWPQSFKLPPNQGVTLEIKVDSKNQPAKRAEVIISFDPQFLLLNDVQAATGVSLAQKALNTGNGILQLSGVGDFKNNKTLATFKIRGLRRGTTALEIQEAHVWDVSGQVDIVGGTMGAEITIE